MANCRSCSAPHIRFAPRSKTATGPYFVGKYVTSGGRSIPSTVPIIIFDSGMSAFVSPADTAACTWSSATSVSATRILELRIRTALEISIPGAMYWSTCRISIRKRDLATSGAISIWSPTAINEISAARAASFIPANISFREVCDPFVSIAMYFNVPLLASELVPGCILAGKWPVENPFTNRYTCYAYSISPQLGNIFNEISL